MCPHVTTHIPNFSYLKNLQTTTKIKQFLAAPNFIFFYSLFFFFKKRRYIHGKPTRRKTVVDAVLIVNQTSMELNQGKMEMGVQINSSTFIKPYGSKSKTKFMYNSNYVRFKHTFHKSMTLMYCVHLALWV